MTALVKLEGAVRALAEAKTLEEVKHVHDIAQAAAEYARAARLGLEAQNHAAEVKLRAERKAGELLAGLEAHEPGRPKLSDAGQFSEKKIVLDDAEITRQDASRWEKIATLPEETFEQFIAETVAAGAELTTTGALRVVKKLDRLNDIIKQGPPLPSDKFGVIYADPPWKYEDHGVTVDPSYGGTGWHYPSMTIPELCALPVGELAEPDCALFIWVTSPKLNQVWDILAAWGFNYKTSFVWDKVKHNFGYYNSVRHEFLLIAGRGSSTPEYPKLYDSVQTIERSDNHSEKPEEFRRIIEDLYPSARKIELFARHPAEGWTAWGNEVDSD